MFDDFNQSNVQIIICTNRISDNLMLINLIPTIFITFQEWRAEQPQSLTTMNRARVLSHLLSRAPPGTPLAAARTFLYGGTRGKASAPPPPTALAAEPFLNGSSSNYVEEMYTAWLQDPKSVHQVSSLTLFFWMQQQIFSRLGRFLFGRISFLYILLPKTRKCRSSEFYKTVIQEYSTNVYVKPCIASTTL